MADLNGFNANEVDPAQDFEAVPAGRYEAMITESQMKDTSAGTGKYLQLDMQILGGEYEGRMLFARLNLQNPSEKAVQIARGQLSAICRAVGVLTPKDSTQLHNLPLIVRVDREEYEPGKWSNPVKAFYPREQIAHSTATPTKQDAPKTVAKPATAPWAGAKKN